MVYEGIDISQYQASFNTNVDFVIIRLGYSITEDPRASDHVGRAKANNVPYGGYWALYEGYTGTKQAEVCYALMRKYGVYRVAVDAEQFPHATTLTMQTVRDFITRMQELNGDCGIYSGYWIKAHGGGTAGADWGWLADYTARELPSGWTTAFAPLWQYTSSNGTLDCDRLYDHDPATWFAGGDEMGYADFKAGVKASKNGDNLPANASDDFTFGYNMEARATNNPKPVPGPQGPKGDPGATGPQGPKGDAAVIAAGTKLVVEP